MIVTVKISKLGLCRRNHDQTRNANWTNYNLKSTAKLITKCRNFSGQKNLKVKKYMATFKRITVGNLDVDFDFSNFAL